MPIQIRPFLYRYMHLRGQDRGVTLPPLFATTRVNTASPIKCCCVFAMLLDLLGYSSHLKQNWIYVLQNAPIPNNVKPWKWLLLCINCCNYIIWVHWKQTQNKTTWTNTKLPLWNDSTTFLSKKQGSDTKVITWSDPVKFLTVK